MTTALDRVSSTNGTAGRLGQATAVEQSRAVAEVQAAIVVAQQCPRNTALAIDMMRESCQRKELAERAFFSYKRGSGVVGGPSVHLARELARCWGNIQYGLREMRRDDEASEMLAYAWDVQTNARCDNIVINPHRGYTGGRELTDLRDVYENNANVGARRVREAIFAVLPAWYVEEAITRCNDTLRSGDGKPLPIRVASAIEVFGNLGITTGQLEARFGASSVWDERTVAQLLIVHRSIIRGEITKDEAFPPAADRVTADDILKSPPQVHHGGPAATQAQVGKIQGEFKRLGFTEDEREQRLAATARLAGLPGLDSTSSLRKTEAHEVIERLTSCTDRGALVALLTEGVKPEPS